MITNANPCGDPPAGPMRRKLPSAASAAQEKDDASLLNFVKKVNAVRRAYPAIARGEVTAVYDSDNGNVSVSRKPINEIVYLVINAVKDRVQGMGFLLTEPLAQIASSLCPSARPGSRGMSCRFRANPLSVLLESSK
jgi:glycosidase